MTAERLKPESSQEIPGQTVSEAREHRHEKVELSQEERENLCRERMIQMVVMRAEEVGIAQRIRAADYIKDHPGTWRHFEPGVCDVIDDRIEDGTWHFVFKFTTDGPDNGWEVTEKIPLGE